MSKRVNYMELLKEAAGSDRGSDTTKSVDVKGPFLDPILGYDGGGEIPTHKDAASILERYYFNNAADKGVSVAVEEDAAIPQVGKDKAALPEEPEDVDSSKKDIEDAVNQESELYLEDEDLLEDDVENAVLERLIAEMEESDDDDEEDEHDEEEEVEESSPPQDPAAKFHEPSGDPDDDSSGLIDGDDKKGGEGAVKPATFPAGSEIAKKGINEEVEDDIGSFDDLLEMEEEMEDEVAGGEETPKDKDLDVDKELEDVKESGAPVGNPKTADEDELSEAFDIFKEEIEDDDVAELDDNDVIV